jgi:hypothetical protein
MDIQLIKQKTPEYNIYSITNNNRPILWDNLSVIPHPDFFLTDLGINKKWMSNEWINKYDKLTQEIIFNMNRKTHTLHQINDSSESEYLHIKPFPNSVIHMYNYNGDRIPPSVIDARDVDSIYINLWLSSIVVINKIITVYFKINKITMFQCPKLINIKELDFNICGRFSIDFFDFDTKKDQNFETFIRKYLSIPIEKKINLDNTKYYEFNKICEDYVTTNNRLKNGLVTICIDSSNIISVRDIFWTNDEKIILPQMFSKNKLTQKNQWFNITCEI